MRRDAQRMPKSWEKSARETHNMTKIREKMQCYADGKESKWLAFKCGTHSSGRYTAET
jgi:hypothetical protein